MNASDTTIIRMQSLLENWQRAGDLRCVFLDCYTQMTINMLTAIHSGEFHDNAWALELLEHFAEYYFKALEAYELNPESAPLPWQTAFTTTRDPQAHVLQHLMLGINAHINYDLVFALEDILRPEWQKISPDQLRERYEDHCHVNLVISNTLDAVQDSVVERFAPKLDIIDVSLGRLDELSTSYLISIYRDRVWHKALERLETQRDEQREAIRRSLENSAYQRAQLIQGWSIMSAIKGLFEFIVEEP